MHPFRRAVEAGDISAVEGLFADDAVFTSPVVFKPYHGKAITAAIVRGAARVFQDIHYVREIVSPDGRDLALMFKATVNGRQVHGCDFLHLDESGLIDDLTVMVRPLSAATEVAQAMGAEFEQIQREAAQTPVTEPQ
ncbi:nuclear transport factor 2 family protein [Actinomadura sp. B10D3]|uniref:nuclear transport factor 2 family protein n=1 Tax=Actinomadura sp. B10D3 TaxID=3153557 RepID=UPI00325EA357